MTPTIGDTVHYVSHGTPGGEYTKHCRAAIVTETPAQVPGQPTCLGLAVLNPTGMLFNRSVPHDGGHLHTEDLDMCTTLHHEGGTWHLPTKEQPQS